MTSTASRVRLVDLLSTAEHRVAQRIEQVLRPSGITVEQWRVMCLLSDGAGHPMSEIARHALLPAPTLTKQVDRMSERGLAYRRADSTDRRRVLVFLSARGSRLFTDLDAAVSAEEAHLAGLLGASESRELGKLLAALSDRLP